MKLTLKIILFISLLTYACSKLDDNPINPQEIPKAVIRLRNLLDKSDTLLGKNDFKTAQKILIESLQLSKTVNDSSTLAGIWNNIGVLNSKTGNQDSSILAYKVAINIAKDIKNIGKEAVTLKNLAISYKAKGQFQRAISNYIESLVIMKSLENHIEIASINNGIGNIYNSLHDYDKALDYLIEAREIWTDEALPNKAVLAMGNLGNTYLGLEKTENAIDIYQETLQIKRSINDKNSIAITLNNLGEAFNIQKNFSEAERCFLESIQLRKEAHRESGITLVSNNLALLELKRRNFSQAQEWLDQAELLLKKYPSTDRKLENLRLQKKLNALTGKFKEAYEIDLKYDDLKQNDFDKEFRNVQQEQYDYDIDQEEKAKELYKAQLEVSEADGKAQLLRTQVREYALIIIILIAIIISYFAFKLRKQNSHIENLMRELHHRVKNHLGMISGMFGAQSLEAGSNTDLLEEARARVEAVNGIHRRLYRQDEYEFVNMQKYLTELVDNSALIFGVLGSLETQLEIGNEPLEIDKAISVGLIANEVLTNAFKYGLQKTEKPVLKIVLEKAVKGYRMLIYNNAAPETEPLTESTGFGSELIKRLTDNLKGESHTTEQNGFHFELTFP